MFSFNKVLLAGNLTRDPELRYTPQGTAVTTLGLALNNAFKDKNGQMQKDTCFLNVVVWAQMAEVCNQYLQKGRAVFVEGRLKSRSWQDTEGKKRNVLEVVASRVQFLSQTPKQEEQGVKVDSGAGPEEVLNLGNENQEVGEAI